MTYINPEWEEGRTNPERKTTVMTDSDGSKWPSANGDIIGELFERSPVYRRETPDLVELENAHGKVFKKIGPSNNGERVVRVFVDAETALENCDLISGWGPKSAERPSYGETPTRRELIAEIGRNNRLAKFIERRFQPDAAAIAASNELFEQIDDQLDMETLTLRTEAAPVGGSPNVGAYLVGSPNSMYRQVSPLTSEGVVRIFVDLSSSGGYSNDGVRGRGVAMLALARCIQRIRPVELWVGTTGTAEHYERPHHEREDGEGGEHYAHTCFMMRLGLAPFDLTVASRMLCDPFGGRGFCYYGELLAVGNPIGGHNGLAWSSIPFEKTVGATKDDICFGPMYSGAEGAIGEGVSAVEWVRAELKGWLERSGETMAAAML